MSLIIRILCWLIFLLLHPVELLFESPLHTFRTRHWYFEVWGVNFKYRMECQTCKQRLVDELSDEEIREAFE